MEARYELFTSLIAKINRNIRRIKIREMADYDLRPAHISCLYYLYIFDTLTATELCERAEEDKATVSRTLDYLEQNGYLTRTSTPTRRYRAPLVLTEKGAEVGRRISERIEYVLDEVNESLSDRERADFYRSLKILSDRLEQIAGHTEPTDMETGETT